MPVQEDNAPREPSGPAAGPSAHALLDADGVITGWDAPAQALFGYSEQEALGRPLVELLAFPGPAAAPETPADPDRAGTGVEFWPAQHRDGSTVQVGLTARPVLGTGRALGWSVRFEAPEAAFWDGVEKAAVDVLLADAPLGVHILGTDLRIRKYNPASPGLRTLPPGEVLGRRPSELTPGTFGDTLDKAFQRVLDTGEPLVDLVVSRRPPADPDREHVFSLSAFRLQQDNGPVLGVAALTVDITEYHEAQARLELLYRANRSVGTVLDARRTAQELADIAVPALADSMAIDILDSVLQGEEPVPGPVVEGTTLRRVGFRTVRGRGEAAYTLGEVHTVPSSTPFSSSLEDLRPRLLKRLDPVDAWLAHDPVRAAAIRRTGVHSLIITPLSARGVVLGMASFYRWERPDAFSEDDLALAVDLAAQAALSIDNARRDTREHTAAGSLQRSLLPWRLPNTTAVEAVYSHQLNEASGAWFDVVQLSGARVALVVGEVAGGGLYAAATMGRLRTAVHTLASMDLPPDELLTRLDDLVIRLDEERRQTPGTRHAGDQPLSATCLYVVYDPVTRQCTFASAGHPPPVFVCPEGTAKTADVPVGEPLGAGGVPFEAVDSVLPPGTLLALFTNGLLQTARADGTDALSHLKRVLTHRGRPLQDICDAARYTQVPGQESAVGDFVLLLARTNSLSSGQVATWTLPNDPAVVATARTLTDQQLASWDLTDLDFPTELIVTELTTNAIRYAEGPIGLRLIKDRSVLICEVSDGSSTAPRMRHAHVNEEGGRGLFLVAQLSQRWGTRYARAGKTIWAEQTLPAERGRS